MEKYFLPFVIIFFLTSTVAAAAFGQDYIGKHPGQKICVESRSCAINYMNNLEKEQE